MNHEPARQAETGQQPFQMSLVWKCCENVQMELDSKNHMRMFLTYGWWSEGIQI